MSSNASLNAGFLISTDHIFGFTQCLTVPEALVEVQHRPRFLAEISRSRELPVAELSRLDGGLVEPSPHRADQNRFADSLLDASGDVSC